MAESNKLYITFKDADLLERFDSVFPVRNSEANIATLLDCYLNSEDLQRTLGNVQADANRLVEEKQALAEDIQRLTDEKQSLAEEKQNLAVQLQSLAEEKQNLAEALQDSQNRVQELAESNQSLVAQADIVNDSQNIIVHFPTWAHKLLQVTLERLSQKQQKVVTGEMVLLDMFIRYTVEHQNDWFYKPVISDREIEQITGYTLKSIKKSFK